MLFSVIPEWNMKRDLVPAPVRRVDLSRNGVTWSSDLTPQFHRQLILRGLCQSVHGVKRQRRQGRRRFELI